MVLAAVLLTALLVSWSAASAFAEDGLPPGVSVPSWAVSKQIHFDPVLPTGSLAEPGLPPPVAKEGPVKYFGGPVEVEPALFLIFWGKNWQKEPGQALKAELLKMYEGLGESTYQKILTQYDSPGGRVASGPNIESIVEENSVTAPTGVNSKKIKEEAEKERELAGSKKNMDDQYVVLPAPGSTYENGFDNNFCGYHEDMGNEYGSLDFIPYMGDPPFSEHQIFEGLEYEPCTDYGPHGEPKYNADYATSGATSHEYAESVTDPEPYNGWATEATKTEKERGEDNGQEVADLCQNQGKQQMPNGAWVTELWDDSKNACELADESPTLQEIGPYTAPEYEATLFVTPTSAQLDGGIEPCGLEAHYFAEYGKTTSYGTNSPESTLPSGYWGPLQEPVEVSGLKPNTLYDWHIVVKTSHGTAGGANHTFTTPYYPIVQSEPATGVRTTRATFNGTVNPEGAETTYWFEYGTTESYGSKTIEASAGSGTASVEESTPITTLATGTTYYFRIAAHNTGGTTYGADEVFTTPASAKPNVETKAATGIGETGATLNGVVDPENAETKYYFEYGTTQSYGSKTPEASAGSGTTNVEESKALTGLAASTTYHFRLVATNSNGTTDGADNVFSTTGKPTVETKAATGLTSTEATLHGTVNPRGAEAKYYFEYGTTESYGSKTPEASAGLGTTSVEESKAITGLKMGTTYHFRIVAVNSHGTTDGGDRTLTTTAPDWYVKKAGVFKAVTETVDAQIEGSYEMIDTKWFGGALYYGVVCKASDETEIKTDRELKILHFYGESCKPDKIAKEPPTNACEGYLEQEGADLPWTLELYTEGSEIRGKFASVGGTPFWEAKCDTPAGSGFDGCQVNTSTHMTNNTSAGTVEAAFDTKSSKTKCTKGGTEAGEWKGTLKIKATSKEVEAIKME